MKKILLTSIALLLAILLFSCNGNQSNGTTSESKKNNYEEVLQRGKIRVGYISYPPSFIKDPNTGKFSGILHEVLIKVGKKLDLEIDYTEEVGWGTMIEAIKSDRVDLVCTGVWPTTERGKHVNFTNPIYYSTVRAYTKADNSKFDENLNAINSDNIKISTLDGEMTSTIAQVDFPNAQEVSLSQVNDVSQVLLEVATGKADVTFVEPAIAMEYISNNPNKIKAVEGVPALRVFPNTMIVGKEDLGLLNTINIGIDELINNGSVDKIIDKYEKHSGSFQRLVLPYRQN